MADTAPCPIWCYQKESAATLGVWVTVHAKGCPNAKYHCEKCGKTRVRADGSHSFTCCDSCWDENDPLVQLKAEIEALKADVEWHRTGRDECRKDRQWQRERIKALEAERDEWRDKSGLHQIASEAHKTRADFLEATFRAALEEATLAEYMIQALDGEPSDFAQSFEPVRRVMQVRAEVARLEGLIAADECARIRESCGGYCKPEAAALHAEARAIKARKGA